MPLAKISVGAGVVCTKHTHILCQMHLAHIVLQVTEKHHIQSCIVSEMTFTHGESRAEFAFWEDSKLFHKFVREDDTFHISSLYEVH